MTWQVYTGLGLRRVKSYVQFLICITSVDDGEVTSGPRKNALARLILADGQGHWTRSPGRLQHYPMIFGLSSDAADILTCTPSLVSDKVIQRNLLEGLQGHISGLLGSLLGRRVF
jgi:hypothetical protein